MASDSPSVPSDCLPGQLPQALIVAGARLQILKWDAQATRLLGWSEAEAVNQPLSLIMSDTDLNRLRPAIEKALASSAQPALGRYADYHFRHKQGTQVSADLLIISVYMVDGPGCGLILQPGSDTDAAVQDLQETLKRREATLDAARIGLIEWDLEHGTLWKSQQGVALITGNPETPMQTFEQFLAFVLPEDRDVIEAAAQRTLQDGTMQQVEYRVRWPDGETHWISTQGTAIRDESGRYSRIFGVELDVTRRKRAEEQFQAATRRIERILESISDAFFSLDAHWRFAYVNRRAEELLNRRKEELLGRNIWDEFPNEVSVFHEKYQQVRDTSQPARFEEFYAQQQIWIDVHVYPHPDGLSVFFSDITQQKQLEQSLRHLSQQLQTAREEERARIAREIHDELGSTLAVLKMDISSLLREIGHLQGGQAVGHRNLPEQVDAMIQSLRRIIDDLRPSILDTFGLWAALEWLAHQFQERHAIHCNFRLRGKERKVESERATAIFRIVQEALTNIVKHAGASEVTIFTSISRRRVVICICDNGCGFDPLLAARPDAYGLLGIRERVDYFGGKVTIGSNRPKGMILRIDMPLDTDVPDLQRPC